ncbi:hypothetical protein BMJ20_27735 [Sinorhizobium medicae]|nr:hypothetical protein BMJ20_27735 [Sinorhizobium medicae]
MEIVASKRGAPIRQFVLTCHGDLLRLPAGWVKRRSDSPYFLNWGRSNNAMKEGTILLLSVLAAVVLFTMLALH